MICKDVKGNQNREAQQMLPAGAGTAPAAGYGVAGECCVAWVGQQHRFEGYCGRAPRPAADSERPPVPRPRRLVVRIAPRPVAEEGRAAAKAA